jgi:hypothetical protein
MRQSSPSPWRHPGSRHRAQPEDRRVRPGRPRACPKGRKLQSWDGWGTRCAKGGHRKKVFRAGNDACRHDSTRGVADPDSAPLVRARAGLNPMDLKRGIDQAVTAIADELGKLSRSVTTSSGDHDRRRHRIRNEGEGVRRKRPARDAGSGRRRHRAGRCFPCQHNLLNRHIKSMRQQLVD